uniref:Uncharacterized protein n=1 Tax=Siphoviridae sp. ctBLh2 TaxID=2827803 RepID=A0A8S5S4L9_9CAUD|nr:MAG TPA: hypothetical protein [Siphoviridae sp. ctBLh2]
MISDFYWFSCSCGVGLRPYAGLGQLSDRLGNLLHEPLGRRGRPANAHRGDAFEPCGIDFCGLLDVIGPGIGPAAHFEEHLAVRRLAAADEDHGIEPAGEPVEMLLASGYLAADRVVEPYLRGVGCAAFHLLAELLEEGDALRGLREEVDRSREVDAVEVRSRLDDDRRVGDLAREPDHLGVPPLAEDHDLTAYGAHPGVGLLHPPLEAGHHRAGGVDDLDAQFAGRRIGCRRLPVCAYEEPAAAQTGHVGMADGPQPESLEALHLDPVVYDIPERVDRTAFGEGPLGLRNRPDYAEAESRFVVDLYLHPGRSLVRFRRPAFRGVRHLRPRGRSPRTGGRVVLSVFQSFEPLHEPRHLLLDGHVAVVQLHGVRGLPQRGDRAGHVGLVAFADVALDLLERYRVALGLQFVVAAARPYGGIGRHEYLQFGIGKYHRADVSSVHHHAAAASHLLLHGHEFLPDLRNGAHAAYAVRHLDRADLAFGQVAVHIDVAGPALGVEAEGDRDLPEQTDHRLLIDDARTDGAVLQGIERHGAVHGSGVDEDISQPGRNGLGEGAFSARRESVYGDDDLVGFNVRHWGIWRRRWIICCICPAGR